jgi:intraflagellar transport protein 140
MLTWNGQNIEIYEILVDRGEISLPLFGTIVSDCRKAQFLD